MTANLTRAPTADVAEAAARLTGTPQEMADRLRALLDAGLPKPAPRETVEAARERQLGTQQQELEIAALRRRLADDFAEARGWRRSIVPMAAKELARRAAGGSWHRPAREWPDLLASPEFFRDQGRRAAAAVGHPPSDAVEGSRLAAEIWAAERGLVLSFPDFPSWQQPGRTVLAVFEPTEVEEAASPSPVKPATAPQDEPAASQDEVALDPHDEPTSTPEDAPASMPEAAPPTVPDLASMRPIQAIDLDDVTPADLLGQAAPDWDLVPPTDLLVDEAYQRGLSPKSIALIRRIVRTWSWAKFKPPVCTRVDGRLHVIDGQHTALAAATHGAIPLIPVVVVAAPAVADRARAFVSHATDRLQATPIQVHHAAVLAGDDAAVTIANVCTNAGIDLVPFPPAHSSYGPRQTIALTAIRRIVDRRGAMRARQILEALANADLAPITADHMKVGEALLCDPDYAGDFDAERVTAAMRSLGAKAYAEARELAITKHMPAWKALVAVLYRARKARTRAADTSRSEAPEDVESDVDARRSRA